MPAIIYLQPVCTHGSTQLVCRLNNTQHTQCRFQAISQISGFEIRVVLILGLIVFAATLLEKSVSYVYFTCFTVFKNIQS